MANEQHEIIAKGKVDYPTFMYHGRIVDVLSEPYSFEWRGETFGPVRDIRPAGGEVVSIPADRVRIIQEKGIGDVSVDGAEDQTR